MKTFLWFMLSLLAVLIYACGDSNNPKIGGAPSDANVEHVSDANVKHVMSVVMILVIQELPKVPLDLLRITAIIGNLLNTRETSKLKSKPRP